MATCLKRTSKLFDISLTQPFVNISLRELICPVCCSILIEPVTLPCTHNLCLKCLKGTFEHNSLSCPLCRIRVGSWLRTATKTESLVNNVLWDLIQTKFAKEVESKYSGSDKTIELDADFIGAHKILSKAGEIRKEYEAQLQMVKEEMQYQRQAEQIASEALIQKIQDEEKQQRLVQVTQDELLAKSLVKEQIAENKTKICNYSNLMNISNSSLHTSKFNVATMTDVNPYKVEPHNSKYERPLYLERQDSAELRGNIGLISKICAERHASNVKNIINASSVCKESNTFCCLKPVSFHNAVSGALKHQTPGKLIELCVSNCSLGPKMSTSNIYGTQSKEELRIPNDVVNSQNKSLGVEVCTSLHDDDERMGSAESAGSHDSINQEIHHFKPIKAMPRTPLKISADGKQIDPKLVRVVPILKRTASVLPKPPIPVHFKRIIGCSWSAFRGKTKQNPVEKNIHIEDVEQKGLNVDFLPEVLFDSNEGANKMPNANRINKKECGDTRTTQKSWKSHSRNGMVCKIKYQTNFWAKKDAKVVRDVNEIEIKNTFRSPMIAKSNSSYNEENRSQDQDGMTIENIAERIKKRKIHNLDKNNSRTVTPVNSNLDGVVTGSNLRGRLCRKKDHGYQVIDGSVTMRRINRKNITRTALLKTKQQRPRSVRQLCAESSNKSNVSRRLNCIENDIGLRKTKHTINTKSRKLNLTDRIIKSSNYNLSETCSELRKCMSETRDTSGSSMFTEKDLLPDDEIIKEQERLERLVIQEKEDFELAQRLQAKFDEMERIAGRTRRSKRAIESEIIELDLFKINIGRNMQRAVNSHTAKPSVTKHTINTEAKKRGRPPKRVK